MDKGQKTILLVEDEAIIALAGRKMLGEYGYEVVTARTGEMAISAVDADPDIDLILMDINLGAGIDGTEAAQRILSTHDVPILFLSSHTERELVERAEAISAYGYVVKHSGITVIDASIKMAFKLFEAKRLSHLHQSRLESAMAAANLAWWEMDLETGAVRFDPRKTEMLGYPPEGFRHYTDFTSLIHRDDYETSMAAMRRYLSGELEMYEVEYRIRGRSGDYRRFYDIGKLAVGRAGVAAASRMVAGITVDATDSRGHWPDRSLTPTQPA